LVLIALKEHYRHSRDLEFLERMYVPLLETAANFLVEYRDPVTKLPLPSYDLWEEKRGTSTFTAATVFGALKAAAELSSVLGKGTHEKMYNTAAEEVKEAIMKYLWDDKAGYFLKMVNCGDSGCDEDRTVDLSSAYGVFAYKVLSVDDPRLARAFEYAVRKLSHAIPAGGLARYEGDNYYRVEHDSPGNPWITTTLWYAEYLIARAQNEHDLVPVLDIFSWVTRHALPSGVLSEQLHPVTGEQFSATPLTWSHAAYVSAVLSYLNKLEELGICVACNPAP
jgi:GH15 family glucan-1,4-alpha-glucosidase